MNNYDIEFTLSFSGESSDAHEIDLYDVSQALIGFQRSLALTTHLVLNGEIITQSPSLKGAEIYALPATEGSWKIKAGILVLGTAGYHLATAPNNTPLGHLIFSAYDYVVSQSLGYHVDYNKSLLQLYEENEAKKIKLPKKVKESQLDSVIEKCSTAITEIHRPIYKTNTAEKARITTVINGHEISLTPTLSIDSFRFIIEEYTEDEIEIIEGVVSSYNSNTFKGRIYSVQENRPVSFELANNIRNEHTVRLITSSLSQNALKKYDDEVENIFCKVQKTKSKNEILKRYNILAVSEVEF